MKCFGNYVDNHLQSFYYENDSGNFVGEYDLEQINNLLQEKRNLSSDELIRRLQSYAVPDGFNEITNLGTLLQVIRERMTD